MQLQHFFELSVDNYSSNIALICDNAFISYQELELRANQLANFLYKKNISKGALVGILLERSIESYVAILAILKTGAAYVPIEIDYPDERINYILTDLPFNAILTSSMQAQRNLSWPTAYALDELSEEISNCSSQKPVLEENLAADDLCYVIYTSGSTGKPKGVEITHRSICHYVKAASQIYQINSTDKIYQGFSLAFDASLEELWMAFAHGAALIACTAKEVRSGLGLISFLKQYQVSVFSTVPTLLATLEGELPDLRILILGGETCTSNLIERWSREGLRIINTYGPTEAAVVATYAECDPEQEITIGKPLPGYELLIVDEQMQEVIDGAQGELCIAGIALARGYANRPESTAEKFVLNPLNNKQRLYRTGDLVSKAPDGNLRFLGRVDDQIKLRGFRIELNEIESVILQYLGIRQAVVTLHNLEQPTLVAYLILEKNRVFDINEFKAFLRSHLPDFMLPSLIEILETFPVLASGKVNRKALPKPVVEQPKVAYQAPKSDLAKEMVLVWERVFAVPQISVNADFFYDLGGHSLHAAQVISSFRKIPALKKISILDLYKNPTINQLEQKFRNDFSHSSIDALFEVKKKHTAPWWKYFLCGIGQFFGCLLQYALGTLQLLAVILCYTWTNSDSVISREFQFPVLSLLLLMPLISLFFTVGLKWLLLGRVKPGEYPLWGWFYYRWWLVQRLQKNLFLAKFLVGSPLAILYYRLLGAKIGKNCFMGSMQCGVHDLLTIGDNTSIGIDSRLNAYIVEDGWLKIGTINIGNNCFIGSRALVGLNTKIENNAVLDEMSMLSDGGVIAQNAYYAGSPALKSSIPAEHITRKQINPEKTSILKNSLFGILHYAGIVGLMLLYYLCFTPSFTLISYSVDHCPYWVTMLFTIPLGAVLFLVLYYSSIVLCKKFIMGKIKPGNYSVKSFYYFRHWLITKLLDGEEISVMADTLYMPVFLRLLGAKLGKGVEMGETPHIIPDLVTIEEGGFTASSVALAWPNVFNGVISFAPVHMGRRAFAGNVSLLSAGKSMGDGTLLGCLSILPADDKALEPSSAWLGSPAVFLPKRELFLGFSEKDTYYPSKKLYVQRLAIELMRITLPTAFSFIALFNVLYVLDYMLGHYSYLQTAVVLPLAELFFTLSLVGSLVALKWVMLGKLKPLTKAIWDPFIWKNDVIEYSYNYYINPHWTNKVLGTPFALWVHRCLGSKVGKRVFTDSAEFSEFDLITVGDEVCINAETIIQTHLYEDRIFKVSHVTIGSGCTIGVGSIVLYNTLMEKNSSLGNLSLLMKGECLPENTNWAGIPAQSVSVGASYPSILLEPVSTGELPQEAMA